MGYESWGLEKNLGRFSRIFFEKGVAVSDFGEALAEILWPIQDGHLALRVGQREFGIQRKFNFRQTTTGSNVAGEEIWKIETHSSANRLVPFIGINRFPQSSDPRWNGFLEDVRAAMEFSVIVFDLRGNPGGDDTKAIEMTSILIGHDLPLNWIQETTCESAEASALQAKTYSTIIFKEYESKCLLPPLSLTAKRDQLLEIAA